MSPAARRFWGHRGAVVGAALILGLVVLAVLGPLLASHDPLVPDLDHGLSPVGAPLPPGHGVLGTDELGRDVWARLLAGAGISLKVGALATLMSMVIGVTIGTVAGYAGGRVDNLLMRFVDLVLSFPFLLLAILLAALLRESALAGTTLPVVITLGVVSWIPTARLIRAKALVLARSELVVAARAVGATPGRIIVRHLLPNLRGLAIVLAALTFAQNILEEEGLAFLGLGPAPPVPTWGRMLFEGRLYYRSAPWLALAPGIAIFVAVVAFNLLGEGLRDVLDPKEQP